MAVAQTRDGFVWLGTQEGLVRFDGVTFTRFNRGNTPALPHNEIADLAEGPDGSLWIGTFGGLVHVRNGRFTAHTDGRVEDPVLTLAVDRAGAVWVGTQGAGIRRFVDGRFEANTGVGDLPTGVVNDLVVDGAGDLYAATARGVHHRRGDHWTREGGMAGLPEVWSLAPAPDGRVWVGTARGLAVLDSGVMRVPDQPPALARASVRSLAVARDGALWAGTEDGEAWRWDGATWSSRRLGDRTSGNIVWAVAEDREGGVWLGTYTSGVHRLWTGAIQNLTEREGLPANGARAVLQTRDGSVWIASEASGLTRWTAGSATVFGLAEGLPHLVVRMLYEDRRGVLWAGTRAGLARFDGRSFRLVAATRGVYVRTLAEDAGGTLWVGTATDGVYRLVDEVLVPTADDGHVVLPRGIVRTVVRDHAGAMWIGGDAGLARWDGGALTRFEPAQGWPDRPVYAVHEDDDHVLWFGTYGGGLVRWKDGAVTRFTQADGLFDDVVYQILEDGAGHLWLSCNNGLFRVSKAELDAFADGRASRITSVAFDEADGMLSSECNGNAQPAGWRTADGRLWFPTTAGVSIVDTAAAAAPAPPPLVALGRVTAGDRPLPVDQDAEIPAGTGRIEFEFVGFAFAAPQKLAFRYRLEGFDADWVQAGARRQTSYTNLPPGRYEFRVGVTTAGGVPSAEVARFAFVQRPHVYQTPWFRALTILTVLGIAVGGVRLWELRQRQREQQLHARVDEALSRIKILSGLIPICASCKRIRDDRGYWNQLESYLRDHSEAELTHGICPQCVSQLYPDLAEPEDPVVPPR